jgi:hypothetical protein
MSSAGWSDSAKSVVLEALVSTTAVTAVLYVIGGVVAAAQLEALDLPWQPTLALLPKNSLLVEGIKALGIPLLLATLVVVVIFSTRLQDATGGGGRAVRVALVLIPLVAIVVAVELFERMSTGVRLGVSALAVIVLVAAVRIAWPNRTRRGLFYRLVGLILVAGIILQGLAALSPPANLEYATIRLKSGQLTEGYYLGATDDQVILAPNVADRTIGIVTEVPRKDIMALSIDAEVVSVKPLAGEPPGSLVKKKRPRSPERANVLAFLADIRGHFGWTYPPIVPYSSAEFLRDNHARYIPAKPRDLDPLLEHVQLQDVLVDPQLYAGRAFRVQGVVTSVVTEGPIANGGEFFVVVRPRLTSKSEAYCYVTLPAGSRPRERDAITLEAVVVAWGTFNTREGKPIDETALACGAARLG